MYRCRYLCVIRGIYGALHKGVIELIIDNLPECVSILDILVTSRDIGWNEYNADQVSQQGPDALSEQGMCILEIEASLDDYL